MWQRICGGQMRYYVDCWQQHMFTSHFFFCLHFMILAIHLIVASLRNFIKNRKNILHGLSAARIRCFRWGKLIHLGLKFRSPVTFDRVDAHKTDRRQPYCLVKICTQKEVLLIIQKGKFYIFPSKCWSVWSAIALNKKPFIESTVK